LLLRRQVVDIGNRRASPQRRHLARSAAAQINVRRTRLQTPEGNPRSGGRSTNSTRLGLAPDRQVTGWVNAANVCHIPPHGLRRADSSLIRATVFSRSLANPTSPFVLARIARRLAPSDRMPHWATMAIAARPSGWRILTNREGESQNIDHLAPRRL
jgi:hypothetical protein